MTVDGVAVAVATPAQATFTGTVDVVTRPDLYLPKAHTCFFSLNLPKYSSDKVWRV